MLKRFPRIKICGITRARDAQLATTLGADYLGLICYRKSPRYVPLSQAREMVAVTTPTAQFVLVCVNEAPAQIVARAHKLRCGVVQIHGRYTRRDIALLHRAGLKVIRAFQIATARDAREAIRAHVRSESDVALFDTKLKNTEGNYGGTGERFDWNVLKKKSSRPEYLALAGGLSVDNFAEALEVTTPLILDFNSGVESSPGIKSPAKLRNLFTALEGWRRKHGK